MHQTAEPSCATVTTVTNGAGQMEFSVKLGGLIVCCVACLWSAVALAQEGPVLPRGALSSPQAAPPAIPGGLSLADAEATALAHNPVLARAMARVNAARGSWLQAGLHPNPEVGYIASEIGNEGRAGQQGLFVAQEFVRGGKLRLSQEVAARDITLAEQELAARRLRVQSDVHAVFHELLISQRRVEIAADLLALAERGRKNAQALLDAKFVGRPDVLRAQIELDMARIELERARQQQISNWRSLAAVMGTPQMVPQRATGDFQAVGPGYDWDSVWQRLVSESPEIGAAMVRLERARFALSRALAEPTPNVRLQGSVQRDTASEDTIGGVEASIPLPLWNRNQGGIQAAQSEVVAAERDVDRVTLVLQQRLAPVFSQYVAARREAAIYQQRILPAAKQTLDDISTGYPKEFPYSDLLNAQRTYFQTSLNYLETLRTFHAARAKIENLLLTDSLQE